MTDYQWTLEVTTKGGPGSGNWRHTGLGGLHGGSDPGEGLGKVYQWNDTVQGKSAGSRKLKNGFADWAIDVMGNDAEMQAIRDWVSVYYDDINQSLRGQAELPLFTEMQQRHIKSAVPGIDSALEKARMPFTVKAKRAMCNTTKCREKYAALEPGDEFTDAGYVSTGLTNVPGYWYTRSIQVDVIIPKGSKAAFLDATTAARGELEILIQRGARFRVVDKWREGAPWETEQPLHLAVVLMSQGDLPPIPWEEGAGQKQSGTQPAKSDRSSKFTWELGDITIFKKGKKQAYEWVLGAKGGPGSGNWAHEGLVQVHGGSDPGGGLRHLGVPADSSVEERKDAARIVSGWRPMGYRPQDAMIQIAKDGANSAIRSAATREGISETEVRDKVEWDLHQILTSSPISIRRTWRGAAGVLEDGRFKTQFESGRSGGAFAPAIRRAAEFWGLGVNNEIADDKHPVYGYVATDRGHSAHAYGPVEFVLKESVKERTTIAFGDSLGRFQNGGMVGTPANAPGIEGWDTSGVLHAYRGDWAYMGYLESQIHGGVSLSDVEKIVFHRDAFHWGDWELYPDYQPVFDKAKELGIEIELDRETI